MKHQPQMESRMKKRLMRVWILRRKPNNRLKKCLGSTTLRTKTSSIGEYRTSSRRLKPCCNYLGKRRYLSIILRPRATASRCMSSPRPTVLATCSPGHLPAQLRNNSSLPETLWMEVPSTEGIPRRQQVML
nr:unnamed protein product [Callosobruchus analis]